LGFFFVLTMRGVIAAPPLHAALVVEEQDACFVVKDSAGQQLAYIYFEEPGRRLAARLLTKDEAR
jgi:hypothetical protein